MNHESNLFDIKSLAFFGKVNASISHELKNIMAIISETAGLLSDLSEMAQNGKPIALDMLTESTESIVEEIQRGFKTIRQMNRFSHSVDLPFASVDLRETLDLVRHLLGYLSFAGKLNVQPVIGDAPMVMTYPFILQTIIYETAIRIFKRNGSKRELNVFIRPEKKSSYQILFSGLNMKDENGLIDDQIKQMATSIGVSLICSPSGDQLKIAVPVSVKAVDACSEASEKI